MRISKSCGILLFCIYCLLPVSFLVAQESISGSQLGWVGYVDSDRIIINDTNKTFSSTVEYLDAEGLPVKSLHLEIGDRVLYRATRKSEVVSIQKVSGSLAANEGENVPTSNPSSTGEGQEARKIKLIDGVWTN